MQVITPTQYVPLKDLGEKSVVYLAGPIRGAGDWQTAMCLILADKHPDVVIVCPCRWDASHPLASHFLAGEQDRFADQNEWERLYLRRAGFAKRRSERGCLLFWLPLEDGSNPRPKEEGPYAQDTYGELGEWRAWMSTYEARLVVGAHPDFPGLRTIQRNFNRELGRKFPIHTNMDETAAAAVRMARR